MDGRTSRRLHVYRTLLQAVVTTKRKKEEEKKKTGKNRVLQGLYNIFLISAQKHRLWVLARTTSESTHNLCFEQKYRNITIFSWKLSVFGGEIFNFRANKSWLDKWVLTIYLSVDKTLDCAVDGMQSQIPTLSEWNKIDAFTQPYQAGRSCCKFG